MDNPVEQLQALKTRLPANCTQANLAKLNNYFREYQQLMEGMPVWLQPVNGEYEANCSLLELSIANISHPSNSARDTKYYFKCAVQQLGAEIDRLISLACNNKINKAI
jgi:hypothetical protein